MKHHLNILFIAAFAFLVCTSCKDTRTERLVAPWGTVLGDTTVRADAFTLDDIISGGELIMLTLYGADTYYDYRGHGMGTQYLLCERFARSIGVSLRVCVCQDTLDAVNRLIKGEGDVIALMLPGSVVDDNGLHACGAAVDSLGLKWAVRGGNDELAVALDRWFRPSMLRSVQLMMSRPQVKRRPRAQYLDRKAGVISRYDDLFRRYAPVARWDWRLLAAQCYMESCFDPDAESWAGARGLMQIMPSTAERLGLPLSRINVPEDNIAAATKYIKQLSSKFGDIPNAAERQCFVLAAYNGGAHHVRDAMALTTKYGGNSHRWSDVARYVGLLQRPEYYNDPVVKYGYMRGNETVEYVSRIRQLYSQYRGGSSVAGSSASGGAVEPRKATKQHRFKRSENTE